MADAARIDLSRGLKHMHRRGIGAEMEHRFAGVASL